MQFETLRSVFNEKEEVQVLDRYTMRWESAKVKAFVNEYSMKILYLNWNQKFSELITIKPRQPSSQWGVRRRVFKSTSSNTASHKNIDSRSDRRVKIMQGCNSLAYQKKNLTCFDTVHYVGFTCGTQGDIPPINEVRQAAFVGALKSSQVMINDPFLQSLQVMDHATGDLGWIDYDQLRPSNWSLQCVEYAENIPAAPIPSNQREHGETNENENGSQTEGAAAIGKKLGKNKRKRRESCAENEPLTHPAVNPLLNYFKAIVALTDKPTLTRVPCSNGIVSVGDAVNDDSTNLCTIKKLYFDGKKQKAMVRLVRIDDSDISMTIPVCKVTLPEPDYKIHEKFNPEPEITDIDIAFMYLCGLKRAIGIASGKPEGVFQYEYCSMNVPRTMFALTSPKPEV